LPTARSDCSEAARRYEQGHNTTFTTFAHYRVRGAIYDGLRKLHGRGIELDANAIAAERGDELLEAGFGDGSSVDDLAGELSDAIDGVTTAALLAEHAADALSGTSPARLAEQRELVERLRAAVARLTPDERELTVALYRDGRSINRRRSHTRLPQGDDLPRASVRARALAPRA
jgi:RNA polymerase sigma factor for flagellar operon FliA